MSSGCRRSDRGRGGFLSGCGCWSEGEHMLAPGQTQIIHRQTRGSVVMVKGPRPGVSSHVLAIDIVHLQRPDARSNTTPKKTTRRLIDGYDEYNWRHGGAAVRSLVRFRLPPSSYCMLSVNVSVNVHLLTASNVINDTPPPPDRLSSHWNMT